MDINLNFARRQRIGLDEAVLCDGKSIDQVTQILDKASERGASFLLTRLTTLALTDLPARHRDVIDYDAVSRTGYFGTPRPMVSTTTRIAVITAGTPDAPAGREAARTLRFFGEDTLEIGDVGVAKLYRLLERLEHIRKVPVIIVAAGMDGELPSVVGGLIAGLVIALPTSAGCGAADGGRIALHASLSSCAPGLLTVNIDNGYGAACAALRAINAATEITALGSNPTGWRLFSGAW